MSRQDTGIRFVVTGKVQGVFFRASAAREAVRLGIRGHAINLPDGRVEVLAIGDAAALAELRRWLARGPPAARVDALDATEITAAELGPVTGFRTG
jgi:acylphosphatase